MQPVKYIIFDSNLQELTEYHYRNQNAVNLIKDNKIND